MFTVVEREDLQPVARDADERLRRAFDRIASDR
jgi:hypothetical protein